MVTYAPKIRKTRKDLNLISINTEDERLVGRDGDDTIEAGSEDDRLGFCSEIVKKYC